MVDSDEFRLQILKLTDALHRLASRIDLEGLDRMGKEKVHQELKEITDSLREINAQLLESAE